MVRRGRPPKQVAVEVVPTDDELLTTDEAAALTKMSAAWFKKQRYDGVDGPPVVRIGRSVRYLKSDLFAWWRMHRRQ